MNQYLASKGLPPLPVDGDLPLGVWRAKYGLLPGQTPAPTDPAASGAHRPGGTGEDGGGNGPAAGA